MQHCVQMRFEFKFKSRSRNNLSPQRTQLAIEMAMGEVMQYCLNIWKTARKKMTDEDIYINGYNVDGVDRPKKGVAIVKIKIPCSVNIV